MKKITQIKTMAVLEKPKITYTQKKIKKSKKKNRKIAKTRRQRGYHWEDTIVKRFNGLDNWDAFRLGSPSVGLPDILAVNSKSSTIFTIEAKSGTVNALQVPFDQIIRCLNWIDAFSLYKTKKVILAFKFLSKKRIGLGKYESRELREFFKVWNKSMNVTDCVCTYKGETFALENSKRIRIDLEDHFMPFNSKHQIISKP